MSGPKDAQHNGLVELDELDGYDNSVDMYMSIFVLIFVLVLVLVLGGAGVFDDNVLDTPSFTCYIIIGYR